jgi:HSP20 family molecular chaperone IbpA
VRKPPIELREKDGQFEILVTLVGVAAKDLDIQVTPDAVLVKAKVDSKKTGEEGTEDSSERVSGNVFGSVHFPERVDPNSVKGDYRNGVLRLTARIAEAAAPANIDVKVAWSPEPARVGSISAVDRTRQAFWYAGAGGLGLGVADALARRAHG